MPKEVERYMKERNMTEIDAYRAYYKSIRMYSLPSSQVK